MKTKKRRRSKSRSRSKSPKGKSIEVDPQLRRAQLSLRMKPAETERRIELGDLTIGEFTVIYRKSLPVLEIAFKSTVDEKKNRDAAFDKWKQEWATSNLNAKTMPYYKGLLIEMLPEMFVDRRPQAESKQVKLSSYSYPDKIKNSSEIFSGFHARDFKPREVVDGYYKGWWYQAIVTGLDTKKDTVDIQWKDGKISNYVKARFIRPTEITKQNVHTLT
jgi:hypothetical protein